MSESYNEEKPNSTEDQHVITKTEYECVVKGDYVALVHVLRTQ